MRKVLFIAAATAALSACGSSSDTDAEAATGSTKTEVAKPFDKKHDVDVTSASCDAGKDCEVKVSFQREPIDPDSNIYLSDTIARRDFADTCYKGSPACDCYGDDFCWADVVLHVNGRIYKGEILKSQYNPEWAADIKLHGARNAAELTGDGKLYGAGESEAPKLPVPKAPSVKQE